MVESGSLENCCGRKSTGSSNLSLSAKKNGGVPEWPNGAVSKIVRSVRVSGVRILSPPPKKYDF